MQEQPEFFVGQEVEINWPQRHGDGVWGVDDDFYGMGVVTVVLKVDLPLVRAKIIAQGFYGAYDVPEAPVRGAPVRIVFDTTQIKFWRLVGDRVVLEF